MDSAGTGTGVMVSNLPLLFTRGFPSSLHLMKLDELEDFVPFMVRCSLGEETPVPWSQLPRPTWWPRKLPFRIPSANSQAAKRTALINLVERCYMFHGCEYLLLFCASLVESMPPSGYRFNDNRDGTTSMYHGTTGKLLVTFRNENRDYDKSNYDVNLRKKLLLSPPRLSSNNTGSATAVFQPAATDIYLCDKCENEFYSLKEVQIHEKKCRGDAPPSPVPPSPDPEPVDEEPEPAGQVPFLAYFKLQPAKHTGLEPYMSPRKRSSSPPRKLLGPAYPRFDSVPLASPLGRFIASNTKLRNKHQTSQHHVLRYERHLHATPHTDIVSSRERGSNRWVVVWRPNKDLQAWFHLYCFNKTQKKERRITIQTGLNLRSRRLLAMCHPLRVKVKRLQKRVIDRVTRLNGPMAPCIDLTDDAPKHFVNKIVNPEDRMPSLDSSGLGDIFNGSDEEHKDSLYIFKNTSDTTMNVGASSSSLSYTASGLPLVSGNSVYLGPLKYPFSSALKKNLPPSECIPSRYIPGDIIKHDSISLIPIVDVSESQNNVSNQMLNSSANHNPHHTDHQCMSGSIISPGPLCSKRAKFQLLSSVSPNVQQNSFNNHSVSNNNKNNVMGGNSNVLNRIQGQINDTSLYAISGSRHEICGKESNTLQQHQYTASLHVKNSQSVPQISESYKVLAPIDNGINNVSSDIPVVENSCIEVIDLSSDGDDDIVKVQGYSHVDNPPQQLDGVAHYSHTDTKVPGSSKFSTPKNGNSHWSSENKSHCDAGRLGDLTTNGQHPNVLISSADVVTSALGPLFVPLSTRVQPVKITKPTGIKINPHKRPSSDSLLGSGGKLFVLDISKKGLKVSQENVTAETLKKLTKSYQSKILVKGSPTEISSTTFEAVTKPQFCKAPSNRSVAQVGDFHSNIDNFSCNFSDEIFKSDFLMTPHTRAGEPESCNSVHVNSTKARNISLGESSVSQNNLFNNSPVCSQVGEKGSLGLIENMLNTVSRGVEFIKSLVSSPVPHDLSTIINDRTAKEDKIATDVKTRGERDSGKSSSVPKSTYIGRRGPREVKQLLGDECRELELKGLGKLRLMDIKNAKVTRRSAERINSKKEHQERFNWNEKSQSDWTKRNSCILQVTRKHNKETSDRVDIPTVLEDYHSACIDENGNSPSYINDKSKSNLSTGAHYDMGFDDNMNNNNSNKNNNNENISSSDSLREMHKHGNKRSSHTNIDSENENHTLFGDTNFVYDHVISSEVRDTEIVVSDDSMNTLQRKYSKLKSNVTLNTDDHMHPLEIIRVALDKFSNYEDFAQEPSCCPLEIVRDTSEKCAALQTTIPMPHVMELELSNPNYSFDFTKKNICSLQSKAKLCDRSSSSDCTIHGSGNLDTGCQEDSWSETDEFHYPKVIEGGGVRLELQNLKGEDLDDILKGGKKSFHPDSSNCNYFHLQSELGAKDSLNVVKRYTKDNKEALSNNSFQYFNQMDESHSKLVLRDSKKKMLSHTVSLSKLHPAKTIEIKTRNSNQELAFPDSSLLHHEPNLVKENCKIFSKIRKGRDSSTFRSLCSQRRTSKECSEYVKKKDIQSISSHSLYIGSGDLGKISGVGSYSKECNLDDLDSEPLNKRSHNKRKYPDSLEKNVSSNISLHKPVKLFKPKQSEFTSTSQLRELHSLGKDKWKELNEIGYYFSDNVHSNNKILSQDYSYDEDHFEDSTWTSKEEANIFEGSTVDKKSYMYAVPDTSLTVGGKNSKSFIRTKPGEVSSVPRELRNLGRDEWKEMRSTGFHPSDVVRSEHPHISYLTGDSDDDDNEDYSDCTENEPPLGKQKQQPSKKKTMSRELLRLLKDECKELKRIKINARESTRHKRTSKNFDTGTVRGESYNISIPNQSANWILKSGLSVCKRKRIKELGVQRHVCTRNTRSQTNVVSAVEVLTPRDSHRQLLHTETAMCVLNYNLPSVF